MAGRRDEGRHEGEVCTSEHRGRAPGPWHVVEPRADAGRGPGGGGRSAAAAHLLVPAWLRGRRDGTAHVLDGHARVGGVRVCTWQEAQATAFSGG